MMPSSAPVIVGGGIVCALGAHLPSVMASITAGAARLSVAVIYGEASVRLGVAHGLLREARGAGQTMAMLADAVDYALASLDDVHLGRYAAVFAVPKASCGPFGTSDTDATDDLTATGVRAGMNALLAERLHPPETTWVAGCVERCLDIWEDAVTQGDECAENYADVVACFGAEDCEGHVAEANGDDTMCAEERLTVHHHCEDIEWAAT